MSPQLTTFFLLVFLSITLVTEFADAGEAQRGAVYFCRFAGAQCRRSVGLLTNVQALSSDMYSG